MTAPYGLIQTYFDYSVGLKMVNEEKWKQLLVSKEKTRD